MNVGFFGDGPWAHNVIEELSRLSWMNLKFVTPRFDSQDPVLREYAEKLGIPFLVSRNVNGADYMEAIRSWDLDLCISMSFNQIIRAELLGIPRLGFINCHAGALPFYRGRNPLNWALINGESSFGITVHYIDEGIDTGDIVKQEMYPISISCNYARLLEVAYTNCASVLMDAILDFRNGSIRRVRQTSIHPTGTYFCARLPGDENLRFGWDAMRCYNFIRALSSPGPGARFIFNRDVWAVERAEIIDGYPDKHGINGQVLGSLHDGMIVKVGDSVLKFVEVRSISERKSARFDQFPVGSRLQELGID